MNASRTADLVLEGGGVRGIALLGAVTELASAGFRFPRIGGTSAGAVIGALVAAYQRAERPLDELVVALDEVDFPRFTAEPALQRALGPVGDGAAILLHEGIQFGRLPPRTGSHPCWPASVCGPSPTSASTTIPTSLADYQRYAFVATASDVSRRVLVRLPWDYDQYGLTADEQSVAAAVRASMAVPFFFRPVRVETDRGAVTWVDGGLLSNFPVQMFDRSDGRADRWPTLGIELSAEPGDAETRMHR
ncbi:Patatin OS=Tsukamurella paurometabola (strain ATCC 8368 / DSM / CCUG 35730 / CIP 100753 / JCM 10117 / KCTC 9821 / NBRC 16120 / NCIMB 702349 / NCTC 13040)OX=521096 GN=Tpau_2007 PE=4 SV=1 [Tsukamurella paurometabola]